MTCVYSVAFTRGIEEDLLGLLVLEKFLQRFEIKPKPRNFLKVLLRNTFKKFLVVRLIGNCCKNNLGALSINQTKLKNFKQIIR